MKKKNGLVFGVGVLVLLCAVYAGVGQYLDHSSKKKKQQDEASKITMTELPKIQSLSYEYKGKELSFTKKEDTWKYDGDDKFPVKQMKLDSLASTVSKIPAIRKLQGGDRLSAYGLDQPIRKINATDENHKTTVILLGNGTEDGNYYAVVKGEDTPYLIDSNLFTETDCGLDDYLALEEFPSIEGKDIQSITIEKDGSKEHYVKKKLDDEKETIEWYRDSADTKNNKVEDNSGLNVLADSLSSLTIKKCSNYKVQDSELGKYGLTNPAEVITYVYEKNGKEDTFSISIGSLNEDSSCYFTRTNNSPYINEIEKAAIDKCRKVNGEINPD